MQNRLFMMSWVHQANSCITTQTTPAHTEALVHISEFGSATFWI